LSTVTVEQMERLLDSKDSDLIPIPAAAEILGLSSRQVWHLIKNTGDLPGVQIHREWLTSKSAVESYTRKSPGPVPGTVSRKKKDAE
jgi:hypothetical protein